VKRDNAEKGRQGQGVAEGYLLNKGHTILARNFRTRSAEIDLITQDNGYVVFVEVKYRQSLRYGYPREAVGSLKQRRIKNCALAYINMRRLSDCDFRFDVVEVLEMNGQREIIHIENAFW
jgi:putative endonuclease